MPVLETVTEEKVVVYGEGLNYVQFKLNALGSKGKPDRLFVAPKGNVVYVEFKRLGEPLRKLQLYWAKQLYMRRCVVYRSDSVEHGQAILENHLDPSALPIEGAVTYDVARQRWTLSGPRIRQNFYLLNGVQDSTGEGAGSQSVDYCPPEARIQSLARRSEEMGGL